MDHLSHSNFLTSLHGDLPLWVDLTALAFLFPFRGGRQMRLLSGGTESMRLGQDSHGLVSSWELSGKARPVLSKNLQEFTAPLLVPWDAIVEPFAIAGEGAWRLDWKRPCGKGKFVQVLKVVCRGLLSLTSHATKLQGRSPLAYERTD